MAKRRPAVNKEVRLALRRAVNEWWASSVWAGEILGLREHYVKLMSSHYPKWPEEVLVDGLLEAFVTYHDQYLWSYTMLGKPLARVMEENRHSYLATFWMHFGPMVYVAGVKAHRFRSPFRPGDGTRLIKPTVRLPPPQIYYAMMVKKGQAHLLFEAKVRNTYHQHLGSTDHIEHAEVRDAANESLCDKSVEEIAVIAAKWIDKHVYKKQSLTFSGTAKNIGLVPVLDDYDRVVYVREDDLLEEDVRIR